MLYQIIDHQHQNLAVAAFQHPNGWQAHSQVVWNYSNTSQPVSIYAGTFNPQSGESFEFFPIEACYWLEPNYGTETTGQQKYGLVCMPPMTAPDALVKLAIPKYRGNRQNLRLLSVQPVPNLAQTVNADEVLNIPHEGVMAHIEYVENGRIFEEEFFGCGYWLPPNGSQRNWGLARLFCFRAERGQLDAMRQTFWQIACSMRNNGQWQQLFQQITQQLNAQHGQVIQAGYEKLQSEARFQQQLNSYNEEVHDRRNRDVAWKIDMDKRQQQPLDATLTAQERWQNELGDGTAYHDPNSSYGNHYIHYGHHRDVWMNEHGEVIGSDDPSLDPNVGSTQTWKRLNEA